VNGRIEIAEATASAFGNDSLRQAGKIADMMQCDVQAFHRNRFSSQSMLCAQFPPQLIDAASTACI